MTDRKFKACAAEILPPGTTEKLQRLADLKAEIRSLKAERAVLRYAIKFTDEDLALARAVVLELAELLKVEK